jgi:hypothetical protein
VRDFRSPSRAVSKKTRRCVSATDGRGRPPRFVRHPFLSGRMGLTIQCERTVRTSLAVAALADAEPRLPDNRIPPSA